VLISLLTITESDLWAAGGIMLALVFVIVMTASIMGNGIGSAVHIVHEWTDWVIDETREFLNSKEYLPQSRTCMKCEAFQRRLIDRTTGRVVMSDE